MKEINTLREMTAQLRKVVHGLMASFVFIVNAGTLLEVSVHYKEMR